MHDHFRQFIQLLNEEGVEYVIVGGFAVAKHGYPRYTGDLDILIHGTKENAENLLVVMIRFGFDIYSFQIEDFIGDDQFVSFGNEPYKIELLTSTLGITFDEAYQNRVVVENQGLPINFIGYEELLRNKQAVGRLKDRVDVDQLRRNNQSNR